VFPHDQGINELRSLILSTVTTSIVEHNTNWKSEVEHLYYEIMLRKKENHLFMTCHDMKLCVERHGITDTHIVREMLNHLNELVKTHTFIDCAGRSLH